jgi:hypothetical protein
MDVDAPGFVADHGALRAAITELEHRLGALIIQVWCVCVCVQGS